MDQFNKFMKVSYSSGIEGLIEKAQQLKKSTISESQLERLTKQDKESIMSKVNIKQ